MKKQEAITYLNRYQKTHYLNKFNTSFSNINNSKPVFWFNINPKKFSNKHYLICIDKEDLILIHLTQEKCLFLQEKLKIREDKNLFDLELPIKGELGYLKDVKSGVDFRPFASFFRLKDVLSYNEEVKKVRLNNIELTSSNESKWTIETMFAAGFGCLIYIGFLLLIIFGVIHAVRN